VTGPADKAQQAQASEPAFTDDTFLYQFSGDAGLAMRGKASKAEPFLIMICSAASAGKETHPCSIGPVAPGR